MLSPLWTWGSHSPGPQACQFWIITRMPGKEQMLKSGPWPSFQLTSSVTRGKSFPSQSLGFLVYRLFSMPPASQGC